MIEPNQQGRLRTGHALLVLSLLVLFKVGCTPTVEQKLASPEPAAGSGVAAATADGARIHYLEIVSPDVDALCKTYTQLHGMEFSEPDAALGNARTAKLPGGGLLGIRAPLRETEAPVVRPYFLVDDLDAAVAKAADAGAQIALPSMPLPGHGKCAVFLQGGAEHGLWELEKAAE